MKRETLKKYITIALILTIVPSCWNKDEDKKSSNDDGSQSRDIDAGQGTPPTTPVPLPTPDPQKPDDGRRSKVPELKKEDIAELVSTCIGNLPQQRNFLFKSHDAWKVFHLESDSGEKFIFRSFNEDSTRGGFTKAIVLKFDAEGNAEMVKNRDFPSINPEFDVIQRFFKDKVIVRRQTAQVFTYGDYEVFAEENNGTIDRLVLHPEDGSKEINCL